MARDLFCVYNTRFQTLVKTSFCSLSFRPDPTTILLCTISYKRQICNSEHPSPREFRSIIIEERVRILNCQRLKNLHRSRCRFRNRYSWQVWCIFLHPVNDSASNLSGWNPSYPIISATCPSKRLET
jgi:hypothetical protein